MRFRSRRPERSSSRGAIAPACDPARAAFQRWSEKWAYDPLDDYFGAFDDIAAFRSALARLFNIAAERVAVTDNTSRASNTAVRLLAGSSRSTVVFDETTYPSARYSWLALTDVTPRVASREPGESASDAVIRSIDDQTVAVSISHVAPLTGLRHKLRPIADAAHRHGAALIVDVAQTAGAMPVDLDAEGIDIAVGTTMKWLLGPPGVGFLCVRDEYLVGAEGLDVGYMGLDVEGEAWPQDTLPGLWPDGRRLELGYPSLAALNAAREGIDVLLDVGLDAVSREIAPLVARCIDGLEDLGIHVRTPREPADRAGVVAFDLAQAFELAADLRQAGVDIGGYDWGLGRCDPHAFNTLEDIDRFLAGVEAFVSTK